MHRRRDILHLLRADIGEAHRELVRDLLVDRARHADAADRRDAFQPRRDVDALAEQIAVALHHVADRDADAERHLAARRIGHVARAQAFLDVDRAAHGFDRRRKFGQHGIARGVEDAPRGFRDEVVDHLAIGGEPAQRLLLVLRDEPAVTRDIRGEDRRDLALHGVASGPFERNRHTREEPKEKPA